MPTLQVEIVLADELNETWGVWFEGLLQNHNVGSTCLSGSLPDYSALYGLLERIRDLNLHLVSVQVKPTF